MFTGDYITGDVDDAYLVDLGLRRNDQAKTTGQPDSAEVEDVGIS